MHDTVTCNHRCRSAHELCQSVARFLEVVQPFPGNGHGAAHRQPFRRMLRRTLLVTLSPAVLPGCFSVPGDTDRSVLSTLSVPEQFAAPQMTDSRIVEGLLDVFRDDTLRRLVDQALSSNIDTRLAARQLEEAGFEARAEVGSVVPKLTGTLSDSRLHDAKGTTTSRHTPSLDVSWEIDLWGKLRDQRSSRDATARASLEHYQAVRDSIAAQVMQAWFDVVTADRLARLERLRLDNLKKIVTYQRRTYEVGLGSLDDVAAVERDIAQTRATVTEHIGTRNDAARTLQVLMGAYPGTDVGLDYELPALMAPPRAGIPASLLGERPDLRAAWQEVVAADRSVRVAQKEMLPALRLTGTLGKESATFTKLAGGASVWALASSLTVPVFNAAQLENRANAAQKRAEQAWLRYLRSALNAFREVEQALDGETLLAERELRQHEAVSHAEDTANIFTERYKNGLVSILESLGAQNTVFDMRKRLLDIRNSRLKNRVSLALALGQGV